MNQFSRIMQIARKLSVLDMLLVSKTFMPRKLRGLVYSIYINSGGRLSVGIHSKIFGGKNITSRGSLYLGDFVWLDAIKKYKNQNVNGKIEMGENVILNDFVHISSVNKIKIGDNVLIGSHVYITDHQHGNYKTHTPSNLKDQELLAPVDRSIESTLVTTIEDNVWIGDGVVIMPGVTVGEGAIVGANTVVCKNIHPYTIVSSSKLFELKKFDNLTQRWVKCDEV